MIRLFAQRSALALATLAVACSPTFVVEATPGLADPPFSPGLVCQEQNGPEGTPLVLAGDGLSPTTVDVPNNPSVILPALSLTRSGQVDGADGGDDAAFAISGTTGGDNAGLLSWQSQQQMTLRLPDAVDLGDEDGALPEGLYDLQVTLADGQIASAARALAVIARPHVLDVDPPLLCLAQGERTITIGTRGALVLNGVDGAVPGVTVGDQQLVPTADGCVAIAQTAQDASLCDSLTVTLPQGSLADGPQAIEVQNPAPADCQSEGDSLELVVVPPPVIAAVAPAALCSDAGVAEVVVSGSGFLIIDAATFTVTVNGAATAVVPGGCTPVAVNGGVNGPGAPVVQSCTSFALTLDTGVVPVGDVAIAVENPAPAGCSGEAASLLVINPAPVITSLTPAGVCTASAGVEDVVVDGSGFLIVDGVSFTVDVDGTPRTVTPTGCVTVPVSGRVVESCSSFSLQIDATGLPAGDLIVTVDNPELPGCLGTASAPFELLAPPTVTAVVPTDICSDVASTFDLVGTNLAGATTVLVGDRTPDSQVANGDNTRLTVTFNEGLPVGDYPISVSNGDGCDGVSNVSLTVNPTPLVFFVNPPVTFNGIAIEATVFASGMDTVPDDVVLVAANGDITRLVFTDGGRPGRVLATVPAALVPGDYAVRVTNEFQCTSVIDGALEVTDTLTLAIGSIDPGFASPTVPTGVTLRTLDPIPVGQEDFENVPQVYLNPSDGSGTAIALRAVELVDATTLNAIVTGAAPGVYDVVVVNPSGAVGILSDALTVTAVEPPRVTAVAPGSLDANGISNVTVFGANFDDVGAPTVSLECQNFADGAPVPVTGAITVAAATSTSTALDVTIDATGITAGAVCVVVVENPDGAISRFSALSFKNSSQNLNAWRFASPMVEARRAPVFASGRPTDTSRFVYAIGGDAGAVTSAKTSVEAAPVDAFGEMGAWTLQRNTLAGAVVGGVVTPSPRTQAGVATVGRYIYVVGGDDGTGAKATVLRAQILDPLAGPEILDLGASLGVPVGNVTPGLPVGLWIYRVAAVFPLTDADNPGGESLGGELFNVDLPDLGADRLVLELAWEAVPGASGYRLYRSPTPDVGPERLELLATTVAPTFTDDGRATTPFVDVATTPAATPPLPAGSLGTWHTVSSLITPRAAQGTVAVADRTNAAQFFLYAAGGRTTGGAVIASGEVATITVAADGRQTISAWRPLTASLTPARQELVALAVTPADTPLANGQSFVFFSSGRLADNSVTSTVQGGVVGNNGDITTLRVVSGVARAGAGGFSANGFLFLFGGSGNDRSSEFVDDTPTLDNWNALGGGAMLVRRAFIGTAQESAFFFLGGGADDAGAPLNTVEQTIQ